MRYRMGWARPNRSYVYHFFIGARDLCNSYTFFGELERDLHLSLRRCKTCMTVLEKRGFDRYKGIKGRHEMVEKGF